MLQEPTPAVAPEPTIAARVAADAAAQEAAARDIAARAERLDRLTFNAPRTAREMQGLNVRRDLLRAQLERAEEQRQDLANQIREAARVGDGQPVDQAAVAGLRAGLEPRLRDADARIAQLERDIAATDRALTQAPPEVLAQYEQQRPRPPVRRGPDEDDVVGGVFGGLLTGVVLTVAARRVRAWWRRRRGGRAAYDGAPAGVGPDPRIDRLTQAVDAIAVEVERIGEGQRFVTQLMAERRELVPAEAVRTADVPGMR